MNNRKGDVYNFIKNNDKVRSMDIIKEFGDTGATRNSITLLKMEKLTKEKPFECGTCKYWVTVK